jgi:hypothetical protein
MLKKEAAEKVAKLMKLANGSTNPHEASSARSQAEKIVREHGLTDDDLRSGEMASAFDELVDSLQKLVAGHPALPTGLFNSSAIVTDVLHKIKTLGDVDKSKKLRQITTMVRTVSFIAGDNPIVSEVKAVLDSTLKNHGISL